MSQSLEAVAIVRAHEAALSIASRHVDATTLYNLVRDAIMEHGGDLVAARRHLVETLRVGAERIANPTTSVGPDTIDALLTLSLAVLVIDHSTIKTMPQDPLCPSQN